MKQSLETVFNTYDNTSAVTVKTIGFKKGKKTTISLGDVLLVIPKKFYITKDIQKKKKYLGLVIGLKKRIRRSNGIVLKSNDNKILLLNFQQKFLGTRVYGGVCKEIRGTKQMETTYKRIISYSYGTY